MSVLKIRNTSTGAFESINSIKGDKGDQGFVSSDLKRALLQLAQQIPCIDGRGPRYYQDLWNAMLGDDYIANFTAVGDPQIENGILTSSSGGWIETPEAFDPGSNPWELTVKVRHPTTFGGREIISQSSGLKFETVWQSSKVITTFKTNTGDFAISGTKYALSDQWVWFKVVFNGSVYDEGISTDGLTFSWSGGGSSPFSGTIPSAQKTSEPIKAGTLSIGSQNSVAKFDLRETEIKINGQTWWKPYIFE